MTNSNFTATTRRVVSPRGHDPEAGQQGSQRPSTPDDGFGHGELEDNLYDGAGSFFSCDGAIEIVANNISRGLPNGKVKIMIHRKEKDKITKTFDYRSHNFGVNPGHVNFCEVVARYFFPNLDNLFFESYTIEEKMDEINKKLDKILINNEKELYELKMASRGYVQKFVGLLWNFEN